MRTLTALLLTLLLTLGATAQPVPLTYLPGSDDGLIQGHLFWIPVKVGDVETRFILDTGIGVDLISTDLAHRLNCPTTGVRFRGQRMSGQSVDLPLTYLPSLQVAEAKSTFVTAGVWDFTDFIPHTKPFEGIEGFLSLRFFEHRPFTLDYPNQRLILEDAEGLNRRLANGSEIPLHLDDEEGVSLTAFALMQLPSGQDVQMEVDTGSDVLILDERFRPLVSLTGEPRVVRGKDETGHSFERTFGTSQDEVRLGSHRIAAGRLMFQKIIHDGLIGDALLRQFVVTFDLAHSRMILTRP